MRLEDFGITPAFVTEKLIECAISFVFACAALIVLWCLFGIGLARIAKKRGEEKEWYAYLPLLRFYTLGKMAPGCEKNAKVFACLLPTLAIARFIMTVVSCVFFLRAAAAIVFAAENIAGSSFTVSQLITFPVSHLAVLLIITAVISLAYSVIYAFCYYGAIKHMGGAKVIIFTILAFCCGMISNLFLFLASREKFMAKLNATDAD